MITETKQNSSEESVKTLEAMGQRPMGKAHILKKIYQIKLQKKDRDFLKLYCEKYLKNPEALIERIIHKGILQLRHEFKEQEQYNKLRDEQIQRREHRMKQIFEE